MAKTHDRPRGTPWKRLLLLPKLFFLRDLFGPLWSPKDFWQKGFDRLRGLSRAADTSRHSPRRKRFAYLGLEPLDDRTMPSVLVVTNTSDSGAGSLRQAILTANSSAGLDIIDFNIAGSGVHTITPASALPTITHPVIIDGTSQPGYAGTPLIDIDGTSAGSGANGLTISGGNSTVEGLAIDDFASGVGIWMDTNGGNTITADYIGVNAAGTAALANRRGIWIDGISGNTIGGTTAASRNVISGNTKDGVYIIDPGATGNVVEGNYIGTNAAGTAALPNGHGVFLLGGADDNTVGGTAAGAGNVIAGNTWEGVIVDGSGTTGNVIQGNDLGVEANGTTALGNGLTGVLFQNNASDNTVGGTAAGAANIIANNDNSGIIVDAGSTGDTFRGNSIYANSPIGIDLGGDGVTANTGTENSGLANDGMNFPVFTLSALNGNTLSLSGYVGSAPNQATFAGALVDVYQSDNSGANGQGQTYLGTLTADAHGNFSGTLTVSGLSAGATITGTATDASGNTSEFSVNSLVNNAPVLSGANNLGAINENDVTNSGTLVSALIAGQVTDPDPGAVSGIAVTAVDNTNGTWQFSTDGTHWTNFATPTNAAAQLLAADANTRVRFLPNAGWSGTVTDGITFRAWDQTSGSAGGTADTSTNGGSTAFSAATATAGITVNAVDQPPVNSVPGPQSINVNTALVFSTGNGNALSVSDVDADGNPEQVTLTVTSGTLTLNGTAGLTLIQGTGAGDTTTEFTGTLANINAALTGLSFVPTTNFAGTASLTISTDDLGNTGLGGPQTTTNAIPIEVVTDIRVNTTTTGVQQTFLESPQEVATDANGNFVVVWGDSAQDGIYAQRFNAAGVAQGSQFLVNATTATDQTDPTVAMDPAGDFVVTWSSYGENGSYWQVDAQRFNAAGIAQGGEFRVNTTTAENDQWSMVGMNADGSFVITWSSGVGSSQSSGIRAQRYNAAGVAQGGQMQVNTYTPNDQQWSAIAMLPGDQFVIVWSSQLEDGSGWGVYGQRFDAAGNLVGSEFQVNTTTAGDQFHPTVAADAAGDFVVTWTSQNQDGSGYGVFGQRYAANGTPVGGEFQVNTTTTNDQAWSSVTMDAVGDFLVTWTSYGQDQPNTNGIYAQWFAANGLPFGSEFRVNGTTYGDQQYSSAALGGGHVVVVWSGNGPGDSNGVFAQVSNALVDSPPVNSVPGAQSTIENSSLVFSAANSNPITVADADANGCAEEVTLGVGNGTLTLGGTTGLTFVSGANGTSSLTFTGTLANINAALNGLRYTPTPGYHGADTLTVTSNDLGNTGTGGPLSVTNTVPITIQQMPATVGLASAANPASYGQQVTFTATVSGSGGTPTGTVTFVDGSTVLGTGTLNASGVATYTTGAFILAVGSHSITAVYGGDGNYAASTSAALSELVNQDATASAVVASSNPAAYGQAVTFTATVSASSPGSGTPTGTVTFEDGSTVLGTGALNASGVATYTTGAFILAVGGHSITAVYGGDGNYAASTSGTLSETVSKDGTSTALASSASPASYGQPVTFTATVSANAPGSGTPTGTVTFEDGSTVLGTGTLNGAGVATYTTGAFTLSVGSHSITAVYGADGNYSASTSGTLSETVNQDATSTALAFSANPASYGQAVTFTATVSASSPGSGTPTGTVTFKDGSTVLGTGTLNASGVATYTTGAFTLSVGSHSITAVYGADGNYSASTSGTLSETVNQDATSTALASSASPASYGQAVTFTATVSVSAPGSGTPTGTVTFLDGSTVLGTGTLNGAGVATYTTGAFTLSVGSHSITAVYGADGNYTASTSGALSETVSQDATSTALASSANPAAYGQAVTFTATVSANGAGSGTPTGTVTFEDGSTVLGTGILNASGVASYTTGAFTLSVGGHSITAVYGADGNYSASTSGTLSETVDQDATSTALASSASPASYGQPVTFTATVSASAPGSGTPTGTVTFKDGSTVLGTGTLNGAGVATYTTGAFTLSVGGHSITAVYGADGNYSASTSGTLSETVSQDATSTALASSANPASYGQAVTFTATVSASSPGSGTPTGTVTFLDGSTVLGTGTLDASDVATYTTGAFTLSVGSHSITAVYGADGNYSASTSGTLSETVDQDATSTALGSNASPAAYGQAVTFTATVSASAPGSGTPTGTVTFLDGSTVLGTGTLNGAGVATYTTGAFTLSVGGHSITAVYGADGNYSASTSGTLSETVNQDATSTALASSANPASYGQPVTFTATVSANGPGSGTPTGTVTFLDGSTVLGTGTLDASGVATYTTGTFTLSVGGHSITAVYGADGNYTASTSGALSEAVSQDATSTALASSASPASYGQAVTFTATVSANGPGSGTPTGTVTFLDGSTVLGTGTLDGAGVATYTTGAFTLSVGGHSITAVYGADGNYTASTSGALSEAVSQDATSTALGSSASPASYGQAVTFTATVSANAPGSGTPTGTVTFLDGSTVLGTGTLDASGVATYTTGAFTLSVGSHSITAVYGADGNYSASTSGTLSETVSQDATSTALVSSANPASYGQAVTFTATVSASSPGSGTPTGTVTFLDGSTVLGTGTLDASGVASYTTGAFTLSVGGHSITAVYGADGNYSASTSGTLSETVNQDATSTALASSASPASYGQAVSFTATVSANAPGSGTPTGTVTFLDGSTVLGTGTLNASGVATYTTGAFTLSVGSHSITAVYGADGNYTASTSGALSEAVSQDATSTALASSASPASYGQAVTFTATVSANAPGSGTPTGTVTFLDGSTVLGTGTLNGAGVATYTTGAFSLAVGGHSITAVYGADGNYTASTSGTLSETVNQAATSTALASSASPASYGQAVTFTATVSATAPGSGTPTGTVTFEDGSTVLGTGTLDASGVASYTTGAFTFSVGGHSVTAVYGSDGNYSGSTSPALSEVVSQDATASAVVASSSPAAYGQAVTFTATVSASAPGSGTPTGMVTFLDGSTVLGTGTLDASGVATYTTGAFTLAVGSHSITAVYGGDGNYTTSTSPALSEPVNQDATASAVVASASPASYGQAVTFTATVCASSPGSGTPTGTVTFLDGSTVLGSGTLDASGVATYTTGAFTLSVGSHSITAVYGADGNYAASTSGTLSETVSQDATSTALASSASPASYGQAVTFTATVCASSPGSGTPTGTVTFLDGSTVLGTGTLDGSGVATYTTGAFTLPVGSHSITAVYEADGNYAASTSSALAQTVSQDATASAVVASSNPAAYGQAVTFTATVSASAPGSGTPTGTVTFLDGSTVLGTGTLDASGVATYTTGAFTLAVGGHSVTAVYGGDSNYNASTSAALSEVVNQGATASAVVASTNPAAYGQAVTFTATVSASSPGSGTPTDTVTFLDGSTVLGTGTLDASGVATYTTGALTLAVGSHSITAVYGGDGNYTASTSPALSEPVNQDATASAVVASASPASYGQAVTFTATVSANAPGSGTPTGTVMFEDGNTVLGTGTLDASGVATYTTGAFTLSVGSHSITAVYAGDGNYAPSQAVAGAVVSAISPAPATPSNTGTLPETIISPVQLSPGGNTPPVASVASLPDPNYITTSYLPPTQPSPSLPGRLTSVVTEAPSKAGPGKAAQHAADPRSAEPAEPGRSDGGVLPANPLESRAPSELQTGLLWKVLDARARQVAAEQRAHTVDAVFATGLSILASAGFVVWNTQYGYLLFSALAARPLWRDFDPLAVLHLWEKEGKKRKRQGVLLGQDDEEEVLEPLFG